jgi:predicted component of type VI protein secretion system
MSPAMRRGIVLLAVAALVLLAGCGSDEEEATPPPAATTAPGATVDTLPEAPGTTMEVPTPLPGLPESIAGYRDWMKLNAKPLPPRDSDPHLGTKNIYASKEMRANGRFPNGTIIVKEAMRPGRDFIGLIAIMRKERGADPAHNDWLFVEYTRDRRSDPFAELASGAVCYGCHVGAEAADYVWTLRRG